MKIEKSPFVRGTEPWIRYWPDHRILIPDLFTCQSVKPARKESSHQPIIAGVEWHRLLRSYGLTSPKTTFCPTNIEISNYNSPSY